MDKSGPSNNHTYFLNPASIKIKNSFAKSSSNKH